MAHIRPEGNRIFKMYPSIYGKYNSITLLDAVVDVIGAFLWGSDRIFWFGYLWSLWDPLCYNSTAASHNHDVITTKRKHRAIQVRWSTSAYCKMLNVYTSFQPNLSKMSKLMVDIVEDRVIFAVKKIDSSGWCAAKFVFPFTVPPDKKVWKTLR